MKKKVKRFRYDPKSMWVVVQEGGSSTETYVHAYDHEASAKAGARECKRASYNVLTVTDIGRSELEQAAPHLYAAVKRMLRGGPLGTHKKAIEAIELAEKDPNLKAILRATKCSP